MADLNVNTTQNTYAWEDSGQNLIINGGFEDAPAFTAATNTGARWIDGTAAGSSSNPRVQGWWSIVTGGITSTAAASFDNTVSHSGTFSMKLDLLDATGTLSVSTRRQTPSASLLYELLPAIASVQYTFSGWIKTTNTATNGAFIDVIEYNSSGTALTTNSSTKLSGTNGFTQVTKTFTSNASTVGMAMILRHNVAGNIATAWFDDVSLTRTNPPNLPQISYSAIVTPGIQNVSGPKIWS